MKARKTLKYSTLAVLSALASTQALASGYHFGAQSVSSLGSANSATVEASDPSTIFHNPAGLTHLDGTQVTGNIFFVKPDVRYKNAKGRYFMSTQPILGESSGSIANDWVFVPQIYASHRLNNRIGLGIGMYVPFASETEYDMNSVLRYNVNRTALKSIDINPTVSFKINEQHAVGIGLIAQYADAKLRQFADYAPAIQSHLASPSGIALKNAAAAKIMSNPSLTAAQKTAAINEMTAKLASIKPGTADGYADLEGDDWGFGFNIGWIWDINDRARFGVNYRSMVKHTLKGTGQWNLVGSAFDLPGVGPQLGAGIRQAGYVPSEGITAKITTPESLAFQGMYKLTPRWNLFGDLTFTRHSRFNDLNIHWTNPKAVVEASTGTTGKSSVTSLKPHWKDTWKLGLGATWQVTDPLQIRFGFSYDQSPVRNPKERLSTMPDNDRYILGLGTKYDIDANNTVSAAYAFMKIKNGTAEVDGWCGGGIEAGPGARSCVSSRASGSASYRSNAHIVGIQYTRRF